MSGNLPYAVGVIVGALVLGGCSLAGGDPVKPDTITVTTTIICPKLPPPDLYAWPERPAGPLETVKAWERLQGKHEGFEAKYDEHLAARGRCREPGNPLQ